MVGNQLAAARQASGFSLEDVARRTRIPLTRLQALEGGMYELLPPPIFSRGFVRAYAREVGLDPDALVRQYEAERPSTPADLPPVPAGGAEEETPGIWVRSGRVAAMVLGIAAVALLIWTGRESSAPAGDVAGTVAAPTGAGSMTTPAAVATSGTSAGGHDTDGVSAVLTADQVCWVSARADGERVLYRLMQPGEKVTLQARDRIVLLAGDAGALAISLNGGAPQAVGADGAVRTVTLTAQGVQ